MEVNTPPPSSQNPSSELSYQPAGAQPLASPTPIPNDNHDVYHIISSYPFHTDHDYLLGLAAILGHPATPPTEAELRDNEGLVLQTQCFYFARKHGLAEGIDVNAYKQWLALRANLQPFEHLNGIVGGAAETGEERQQMTSPVPRPHAPTPATAAAATTLNEQPHQQLPSPPPQSTQNTSTAAEPTPPYPTSFADIVDLITQNKPIPGIETIPDTVLEPGSSKVDRTTRRRKPWERDDEGNGTSLDVDVDVDAHRRTGEGVLKILQPGAVPDSGLLAQE
ncbi:hypothetical protein LTS08_004832 [Lithohypha guttulata]|uniref:Uncharacterized protein n=2 Tax=Lithohypha guttulata TaxID=1690604 RepID=A0AAN7YIT7_9EURO|nr:hypothetical protein LTR05_002326 [Lithohypha guttulata]KAK5101225.1 hypothetical protein LTS08_004832 [Lithohypha guttulata]